MKHKLYHGSAQIVKKPTFGVGKRYNDYGLGFYCTESIDMAKEWGVGADYDGFANSYDFDDEGLETLNLMDDSFCILHWLSILLQNREFELDSDIAAAAKEYILAHFPVSTDTADIIYGYRADDSYFSFAQNFLNGTLSYSQLNEAMRLGKLGQQYVIKSERAFGRLTFTGAESASRDQWFARKRKRDSEARETYRRMFKGYKPGELYITRIMDEGLSTDDLSVEQ